MDRFNNFLDKLNSPKNFFLKRDVDSMPKGEKFEVISWSRDQTYLEKYPLLLLKSETFNFPDEFGDEEFYISLNEPFNQFQFTTYFDALIVENVGKLFVEFLYSKSMNFEKVDVIKFSYEFDTELVKNLKPIQFNYPMNSIPEEL